MAYSSSDVQEVVTSIDIGRNNELRVSTIKAKDSTELKSMDIRQCGLQMMVRCDQVKGFALSLNILQKLLHH